MHNGFQAKADTALAAEIRGVSFTYPGSEQPVLNEASLTIEKGSFTAIIGGNGCGKSTLCKLFNGLIPHYYSGDFAGEVVINGVSAQGKSVAALSRMVGYVYQDFDNQLVRPTVLDEACFAPLNYGLADYRERAQRALDLCGLAPLQHRYIWELSGGQKHLLALAGALPLEPDLLIVDEPVSQLDPSHARQVYEVLRQLNRDHGKTIIVIEHHTEFIADYCGDVCLMEQGRVLWKLPAGEALNRRHDLERLGIQPPEVTQAAARLRAMLEEGDAAHTHTHADAGYPITTGDAVKYFTGLLREHGGAGRDSKFAIQEAVSKPAGTIKAHGLAEQSKADGLPEQPQTVAQTIIRFNQTSLSYRTIRKTEHTVLHGIDLAIAEGERIALVGNNGAGKSSLLKLIAGIAKPSAGAVAVLGQDTRSTPIEQLSRQVAFVFQNPEDMFIEDNVRKEIAYCLKRRKYPDADTRVVHMLRSFRLEELQDRDARLLSGGQQRRVSLAIGAAVRPAVMLLDEPTANLDLATREELLSTLAELEQHVRTVIIATHDMQLVSRWATRVIVMHEGAVLADGTAADIFASPDLIRRAGLALTQSMELSDALGLRPACSSPAELAGRLYQSITGKETLAHAARPQLV
ncbi:energy-coupling factor ABC transporter ATP-binding protein [Paenibacillus oralis]|uniref:Energy-coupling factor ABC transporter ATP-binding protein n=1 Tax=Paenibacillus oralis TaxID=2490856 RepID=A0A3P3U3R7_9BACL|nr:ABC transporter ATP-binding protein [Paenibacillus oralis]RRJ63233.1 energy-coupling factor ABC transporter ATP-binding protein [Paenibacillus oralis]